MENLKQLVDSTYFNLCASYLLVISLILALRYYLHRSSYNERVVNTITEKPRNKSNFWTSDQIMIACYIAVYQNYRKLDEDYFNLIVDVTGRSKSALKRKFCRINKLKNSSHNNDSSELDKKIYSIIGFTTELFAINQFKKAFENLGGDLDELDKYLN